MAERHAAAWTSSDQRRDAARIEPDSCEETLADAMLAVVDADCDRLELLRLVGRLRRSVRPVLLLIEQPAEALRQAGCGDRDGIVTMGWQTAPETSVAMLDALIRRQPAVDDLLDELRQVRLGQRWSETRISTLDQELQRAARLQREVVQRPIPRVDGVHIGVVFRAASHVSGDMYDVEQLDEHIVSILVADAVGHGIPAAMLTMLLSRGFPKIDRLPGNRGRIIGPAEAMWRLNNEFAQRARAGEHFATAVYALLDTRTMRLRVASAGHPPALVYRESGPPAELAAGGPLLGVFPDAEFDEDTVDLADARGIVFHTDGFELAYPDPAQPGRGTRRYVEELGTLGRGGGTAAGLGDAIEAVYRGLDSQAGSLHQSDDLTAVCVAVSDAWRAANRSRVAA